MEGGREEGTEEGKGEMDLDETETVCHHERRLSAYLFVKDLTSPLRYW